MKYFRWPIFLATVACLNGCIKVIDLHPDHGPALPYIDAWITDQPGVQVIRMLKAVDYTDSAQASPVADAIIQVTDLTSSTVYPFNYTDGSYIYDAGTGSIGITGHVYQLDISYAGQQFSAVDTLKRNTTIDSIHVEFKKSDGTRKEGYYASFYASDIPGATDFYWIRTYLNGSLNFYTGELFSIDGSFYEDISDGFEFIAPVREVITADDHPYQPGDSVRVLIRSLSKPSYDFGNQLNAQLQNGGLFATVLRNVPTNINTTQGSGNLTIAGWFGTVAEVSAQVVIR
jgi:Domain of unknown function (DUF4249)